MSDVTTPLGGPSGAVPAIDERAQARKENWTLIRRRPGFIFGCLILLFWAVCAAFGQQIAPRNFADFRATPHLSPRWEYPFGTDRIGRDVLSRVIVGAWDVLKVAPMASIIGVAFGVALGLVMGYFGGLLDNVLSRIIEAFLALPVVLTALLVITVLDRSTTVVITTIAILFIPIVARTVRAAVMAERDLDYVTSARLRGESSMFIMFREILPNISGPIVVELTVRVGYAVFTVATLSFLGAGPGVESPDWGVLVSENFRSLYAGFWWTTLFPALAIASLVIAVNLIADAVQSVLESA
jgi:peptide/nickel transport system permease protein